MLEDCSGAQPSAGEALAIARRRVARRSDAAFGTRIRRLLSPGLPWLLPALAFVAWQVFGSGPGEADAGTLPRPALVADAAWRLALSGELWRHTWVSLQRALGGLAIGGSVGLVLGLSNGYWRLAERLTDTTVQMIRNVPHLALMPLVIVWFGLGEQARVFLVALGVSFPIYVNTFHGVRSVDPAVLEMGQLYGLGRGAIFRHIVLPGALPSILVGLRFALGVMWLSLIVAETLAADAGIGYLSMNAREFMQTDVILMSIVLYAALGKLADSITRLLERRFVAWEPQRLRAWTADA
jgi:sulfonate transport system permease protein